MRLGPKTGQQLSAFDWRCSEKLSQRCRRGVPPHPDSVATEPVSLPPFAYATVQTILTQDRLSRKYDFSARTQIAAGENRLTIRI